jgi:hypothetical protein
MTNRIVLTGAFGKPAEIRTSKNGNEFATFSIRESLNGSTRWWQGITFSDVVIQTVKEMSVSEPLAVCGEMSAEIYAPAGAESRINWRITVDGVLSARAKPKQKAEKSAVKSAPETRSGGATASASWAAPAAGGVDASDIPF